MAAETPIATITDLIEAKRAFLQTYGRLEQAKFEVLNQVDQLSDAEVDSACHAILTIGHNLEQLYDKIEELENDKLEGDNDAGSH